MRKPDLGNIVAAEMAEIMNSQEHRDLFSKQAMEKADEEEKEEKEEDEDDASAADDGECKCPKDCECNKDGECKGACPCEKKMAFFSLVSDVLKMSEKLDELGLDKSASSMIQMADSIYAEATGATTIEEMLEENPDLDVDVAVVKEQPAEEMESELFDPRMESVELAPEEGDLEAQLKAIEEAGLGGEQPGELSEDEKAAAQALGLGMSQIEAAMAEVDEWIEKNSSEENEQSDDLSSLLTTAEKEVEDYLADKNFEDED